MSDTDASSRSDAEPTGDIIIRTPGLTDDEVAAVVSVVRATLDEELAEQDRGTDPVADSARRWRSAMHGAETSHREWR